MSDIRLSNAQARAVADIKNWFKNDTPKKPCWYLAGYAGVGKSTVVRHIVDDLGLSFEGPVPSVVAATYTAKAALVLSRMGTPATTIHKLIYITRRHSKAEVDFIRREIEGMKEALRAIEDAALRIAAEAEIARREDAIRGMFELKTTINPMSPARDAKLIVLDEISMVNESIGRDLLSFGTPILVIGDPGQLPPIKGQGFFTQHQPDTMLTEIHRQAWDSPIVRLATMARQGRPIPFGRWSDTVWKMSKEKIADPAMLLSADIVLCGLNRTRFMLNNEMRRAGGLGGILPLPTDRLICLKNDYEHGLVNGLFMTMRELRTIDANRFQAIIETEDGETIGETGEPHEDDEAPHGIPCYAGHFLDHAAFDENRNYRDHWLKQKLVEATFGYAISVHKSQGSGFNNVIFWDDGWGAGRPEQRRQLVYTAITRAVSGLLIVE
ncbi:MAG: AAA family ATPase [Xanthobacteraceae bacterium]